MYPASTFRGWNYKWTAEPTQYLHGFWGSEFSCTSVASSLIPEASPQSCEHDPTGSLSGILFDSRNCVKRWCAFGGGETFWFAFLNLILGVKKSMQPWVCQQPQEGGREEERVGEREQEQKRNCIFIFLRYFFGGGYGEGIGKWPRNNVKQEKKSLSGERNCLNFRSVNDLIGEWALTPAPTFLVGRNSSGSQLWLWWVPHSPASCACQN